MRRVITLLLLLLALPLRAQYDLTPTSQVALPAGHSYLIGLDDGQHSGTLILSTIDEIYESPAGTSNWTKIANFRSLGIRPTPQSPVSFRPGLPGYLQIATFNNDDALAIFYVK